MKTIILLIIFSLSSSVFSIDCETKINKGNTISRLLYNKKVVPLWGKKGSVNETKNLNNKDPNFIYPKEIWKMPKKYCNYVELQPAEEKLEVKIITLTEKPKNKSIHSIGAEIDFLYSKIQGRNSVGQGNYVSDLGKRFSLLWNIKHSSQWASQFNLGYQQVNWDENNVLTDNRKQTLWDGSYRLYYLKNRIKYLGELGFNEFPFYKAQTATKNNMEKNSVGSFSLGVEYLLINSSFLDIFTGAKLGYNYGLSNSVYELSSGYKYSGYIKAAHNINHQWNVFSTFSYMNSQLSNSDITYDFTQFGLSIGINKSF